MKLSIIIPIFGVEKYIEKCLYSCIHQDIQINIEYEIICVNDGTRDRSAEIAKQIASNQQGITVIDQENKGLSVARNTGLKNAKGDYVWFVDSDDWIQENCLGGIIEILNKANPDFLQLQYRYVYDNHKLNKDNFSIINGVISGPQQIINGGVPIPAQFAIYRRFFLQNNKLEFYPNIYHEDCEFKPRVLFLAERCTSYDEVVYNYYQRSSGSITSQSNPKRAFDYLKVAISVDNFYKEETNGECSSFFHNYISMLINNALSLVQSSGTEFSDYLYNQKFLFKHLRRSNILKYKIEGYLFSILPKYYVQMYIFLQKFKIN